MTIVKPKWSNLGGWIVQSGHTAELGNQEDLLVINAATSLAVN